MPEVTVFDRRQLEDQAYWVDRFASVSEVAALPQVDPPQPATTTGSETLTVSTVLEPRLSRIIGSSPFLLYTLLVAALKICLYKYSGCPTVVVGSPALHNPDDHPQPTHVLAIIDTLDAQQMVSQLLEQVRTTLLEAYAHQHYAAANLMQELGLTPDGAWSSWCQVVITLDGLHIPLPGGTYDLKWRFHRANQQLNGSIEFNPVRFQPALIQRVAKHMLQILHAALESPEQLIADVALLAPAERQQILVDWNHTETARAEFRSLPERFEAQAARTPDAVAVLDTSHSLTYSALNRRANQLAHALRRLGIGPESCVGLYLERSIDLVVSLLAILKAGGAYLPLDPAYPSARLAFLMDDARVRVLIAHSHLTARLPQQPAHLICPDTDAAALAKLPISNSIHGILAQHPAYVIYTSGSTGQPKGVTMSHQALVNLLDWQCATSLLAQGDRTLQFSSLSFDVSFQELFATWCTGGTLVLIDEEVRRHPMQLLDVLAQEQIARLFLPFVALNQLAEVAGAQAPKPLALLEVNTAGEQLQMTPAIARWFEQLPTCTLTNQYGPSETHVVTAFELPSNRSDWPSLPPIGHPVSNTQVYLLDGELQPVPIGVVGGLYVGGLQLARGYLNRAGMTAARFVPNPFHRTPGQRLYQTGDLARYREDGTIDFFGRRDHQVKIRGFRIELGEIETALSHHPSVTEAVVVAHQRAATDKMLVAYLVPRQAILPSPSEMRIYLQAQLPAYMIPAAFVEVESLPLTSSGKVDRQALPAPNLHPLGVHDAYLAPRNALEQQLVQIWEDLLYTRPIGIHDNFFDLGGHSLLVVRLLVRLQRELGQTLPVSALFQASTIADLAQALQEPTPPPQASSSVIPLQLQGHRPPFFCIHGLGGDVLSFLALARHLAPWQPFYGLQHPGLEQPFAVNRLENLAAYYLKEIRQIQPQGPYIIGGWSLGAIVAFEMAQQLVASGHAVSQLLLLDTAIETQPYATPTPTMRAIPEDDLLPLLVSLGERAHGADGAAFLPQLAHDLDMTPEAFIHAVYRLMQHRASDEATEWRGALGQLSRHVDVFKANLEAATCYQPQVYPGKMTLFRATESNELFSLSSKPGWEDLASEGVTVVSVPGNHYTMLQDPHVQVLADRLHTCLEHVGARDTQ